MQIVTGCCGKQVIAAINALEPEDAKRDPKRKVETWSGADPPNPDRGGST